MLSFHAPYGNTLAAAYFDPETRKIYVMEDTKDTWGWDLACLCETLLSYLPSISSKMIF